MLIIFSSYKVAIPMHFYFLPLLQQTNIRLLRQRRLCQALDHLYCQMPPYHRCLCIKQGHISMGLNLRQEPHQFRRHLQELLVLFHFRVRQPTERKHLLLKFSAICLRHLGIKTIVHICSIVVLRRMFWLVQNYEY